MRQTAKPHATDVRDQGYVAEAIYFTAFCQRGPHDRRRAQVDVVDGDRDGALTDTKAKAQALANEMGKAALVYAVTAAGRSAHVTSIYPEAVGGPTTMKTATPTPTAYASKSAATKAAPAVKKAVAAAVAKAAAPAAGKRAQVLADAQAGKVPTAPDFSADTHKRYRAQLERVQAMVAARDVKGLKAEEIKTSGSSGKALDRYRQLAVVALEAGK